MEHKTVVYTWPTMELDEVPAELPGQEEDAEPETIRSERLAVVPASHVQVVEEAVRMMRTKTVRKKRLSLAEAKLKAALKKAGLA